MSKNMTRKGLAFGAGLALISSGLIATPAIAVGIDGNVRLAPDTGAEYDVRATDYIDLAAGWSNAAEGTGHYMKYLVTAAPGAIKYDIETNGSTSDGNRPSLGAISAAVTGSADPYTITVTTTNDHNLQDGDTVTMGGFTTYTAPNGDKVIDVTGAKTFTYTVSTTGTIEGTITVALKSFAEGLQTRDQIDTFALGSSNVTGVVPAYLATLTAGVFVIDTRDDDNAGDDHVLRLIATSSTATTTATVQAWVDINDNNEIDSTESASPVRTVRFLRGADISATTTIRPATVGDSTVTADVVLTPTLNGNMILRNESLTSATVTDAIAKVDFTRQGDSKKVTGATNGSYSNVTKRWTFESKNFGTGNGWTDTNNTKVSLGVASSATVTVWKYKIVKNVVTITTGSYAASKWSAAAHGLRVGDIITVTDGVAISDRWEKSAAVITSVPTSSSFTFVETGSSTTDIAEVAVADTVSTSTFGLTSPVYLRDKVEAGNITAQFYFDVAGLSGNVTTPTAVQTIAPLATYVVGAKVVGPAGVAIAGVPSATVSAAGSVFKGTTTAGAVVTLTDADGDPVGAGVDVVLTATKTSTGTVKVNGTTVSSTGTAVYAKTDASGKVTLAIENSAAAENDTLVIAAASQGATASRTFTWEDKKYTVHDLADTTAANDSRARVVPSGTAYTFRLLVQDQFKAPAGDDIRLLVTTTGRTQTANIVTLTSGQATVVVNDGGLGTTTSTGVQIEFQKRTSNVWATQSGLDAFQDWAGADNGDLAVVTINYDSTADNLTLNANGANFPGNGTADNAASVAAKALKAIDLRNTAGTAGEYTASETGTVSGQVTNAFGVAKPGAVVTVSGTGLLFNSGDVWALNSVTLLANSSGQFSVNVFSSTFGAKVVTATVGTVSKTFTITYTGTAGDAKLTVTAPTNVKPASTFQVKAKLADDLGNGLDTAAGRVKVTYTGPGIVFGTLPTETDANGELMFSVLLGSNDTGNVVVTVSYDQNGDGDFVDAKDLNTTKTITVGTGAASGAGKVNVGSFNGKLVVYASGLNGARISWKVGGVWGVGTATSNYSIFNRPTPRAGVTVSVDIYVNGVKTLTKSVLTR